MKRWYVKMVESKVPLSLIKTFTSVFVYPASAIIIISSLISRQDSAESHCRILTHAHRYSGRLSPRDRNRSHEFDYEIVARHLQAPIFVVPYVVDRQPSLRMRAEG